MLRSKTFLAVAALLAAVACSGPGRLPLSVKSCDTVILPHAISIQALFVNGAEKPVIGARLQIDFYRDFKFTRVIGIADFHPQLEPKAQRSIALILTGAQDVTGGQAQRCDVVHIDYADGTKADVPQ
jgi:hypothetical protein